MRVVLLSGGVDSSTVLGQAIKENHQGQDRDPPMVAISFRYGAKHEAKEIEAAERIVWWYYHQGVPILHEVVDLPSIFSGGESALMGDIDMPMEEYRNYESGEGESVTVVPFRNANLISAAVTIAEVMGYGKVYAGMHATDHSTWAYPDCTPEFLGAMANAIYVGTLGRVRLSFPLIWMTKDEVVTRAIELDVPLHLTRSCYTSLEVACGTCPTCLERIKAFVGAGYIDPIEYRPGTFPNIDGLVQLIYPNWKYEE